MRVNKKAGRKHHPSCTLLGLVACGLLLANGARAETAADGLAVGATAPRFMLPVIFGSEQKRFGPNVWTGSDSTAPKKWVLLSFFATYCEPCKKEMPELSRLYQTYQDQGLGVFLVSLDKNTENVEEITALARTHNVTFPILQDRFQVVARRYAAERLPYLLMLDGAGTIRKVHQGYSDDVQSVLETEIREGLGLPPLKEANTASAAAGPQSKSSKKSKSQKKTKVKSTKKSKSTSKKKSKSSEPSE